MNTSTTGAPLSAALATADLITSAAQPSAGDAPRPADDDEPVEETAGDTPPPEEDPAAPVPPETPVAPHAAPPAPMASPRTQARVPAKKAAKPGARRSRKAADPAEPETGEVYAVVLQTSRILGPNGRAIARRTAVLAAGPRAESLIARGLARAATMAEAATAVIIID